MSGKATSSVEQIDSITAACPDAVMSKMIQHRASGNGVNCPWLIGSTRQSSTSPGKLKQNKTLIKICSISIIFSFLYDIKTYKWIKVQFKIAKGKKNETFYIDFVNFPDELSHYDVTAAGKLTAPFSIGYF